MAIESAGKGYGGDVGLMIGVDITTDQIIGVAVTTHSETPGLGARITEKWFTDQFKGVPIAWKKDVSDRVIIGRATGAKPENQVDAITGATQTSMALKRFLNAELERIRALNIDGVFGG